MPTKFSKVYESALFKVRDYAFLNSIIDYREAVMQKFLMSAIVDFQHSCVYDLTNYDLELEQFNDELDDEVIEILALGVQFHWLSAKTLNSELLKNIIHNSDYTSYSPGNLLKEIQTLRESVRKEYRAKIATYSFRHGDLESLRV